MNPNLHGFATIAFSDDSELEVAASSFGIEQSHARRNVGDGDFQDEVLFATAVDGKPDLQVMIQVTRLNDGVWQVHSAWVAPEDADVTLDIEELKVVQASLYA